MPFPSAPASLHSILQGRKITARAAEDFVKGHGRTSELPPTGPDRHTGLHMARDPLVIELAIDPTTNLVDWSIVDRSQCGLNG